jgi:hypothetical protein
VRTHPRSEEVAQAKEGSVKAGVNKTIVNKKSIKKNAEIIDGNTKKLVVTRQMLNLTSKTLMLILRI